MAGTVAPDGAAKAPEWLMVSAKALASGLEPMASTGSIIGVDGAA